MKITTKNPLETLSGRRLALVVTGGVAAYKAAELARLFVQPPHLRSPDRRAGGP